MAIHDRIRTTTTQTGVLTTVDVSASAPSGFKKFSATGRFAVNDANIPVVIAHQTINEWQVCFCTYSATDQLTVNTVLASSKSDDTAVSFTAGTKDVFVANSSKAIAALREANTFTGNNTFPNTGLKVQDTDASHVLTLASGALTANRTLTLTTGSAADRTLDISAANVTISTAGAALIDDATTLAQQQTLGAFDTVAAVNAATIDSSVNHIRTAGYYAAQDGGAGLYRRFSTNATTPSHAVHITSNSGQYVWELVMKDMINVLAVGAKGDGTQDDTVFIQRAVDAGKFLNGNNGSFDQFQSDGATVFLPPGRYKLTDVISLTDCHGVKIIGSGPKVTEVFQTTTTKAVFENGGITFTGSAPNKVASNPLQSVHIENMTIRGAGGGNGVHNANAHGCNFQHTHSLVLQNLVFFSCRHAVRLRHNWQTRLTDVSVYGLGTDQTYIGVYMVEKDPDVAAVDNAVFATNVWVQHVDQVGFRIINGQGSKFTSCEAMNGVHGWYIGDPPTGSAITQWMHMTGCLADTTSGAGWLFRAATNPHEVSQLHMANCWAGNCQDGFYVDGCKNLIFSNCLAVGNARDGFVTVTSDNIAFSNCLAQDNNETLSATSGDYRIQGGSNVSIIGCHSSSVNTQGKSLIESASTNNNIIVGNNFELGETLIGAGTVSFNNRGNGVSRIFAGNTERMRIATTGEVGIGRTDPSFKIDVYDSSTTADFDIGRLLSVENPSGLSRTRLRLEKGTGYGGVVSGFLEQGVGAGLSLHVMNNNVVTEMIRLRDSGVISVIDTRNFEFSTGTGTKFGTGTNQKLSFYNATPVAQRAGAAQAAVATTAATQTTPWGFTTQAQADAIVTLLNEIREALVALGLMKGSA